MSEKRFKTLTIIIEDDTGTVQTHIRSELSAPQLMDKIFELKEENEQLKIANARWFDKSLQDKQIRYSNANCKELTKKYLQLREENEQLEKGKMEALSLLGEEIDKNEQLRQRNRKLYKCALYGKTIGDGI